MAEAKSVKVIFGEGYAGNIRVMIGSEEIPNIRSIKLPEVKPGELPEIEIKMLAPKLVIEDKTKDDVAEMEEVDLDLKPEVKVVDTRPTPPSKSTSKKSAK